MFKKVLLLILVITTIFMLCSSLVFAVDYDEATEWLRNKTDDKSIKEATEKLGVAGKSIHTVITSGLYIASFLILVFYGAQWFFAGSDSQKKKALKEQAINYVIGAGLVFGTGFVYRIILSFISGFQ